MSLRCSGITSNHFIANLSPSLPVTMFKIGHARNFLACFFGLPCNYMYSLQYSHYSLWTWLTPVWFCRVIYIKTSIHMHYSLPFITWCLGLYMYHDVRGRNAQNFDRPSHFRLNFWRWVEEIRDSAQAFSTLLHDYHLSTLRKKR